MSITNHIELAVVFLRGQQLLASVKVPSIGLHLIIWVDVSGLKYKIFKLVS